MSSISNTFYVDINQILPGQNRYSKQTIEQKVNKIIKKKNGLKYDKGKSAYSLKSCFPVVNSKKGYVLVDGNHDWLASLRVGAQSVPIRVIADLKDLSMSAFWVVASQKGLVHPYNLDGEWETPSEPSKMKDDPNRYFASITAHKLPSFLASPIILKIYQAFLKIINKLCIAHVIKSECNLRPLWVKLGKDIPFIELKIADVMRKNGLIYSYELRKKKNMYIEFKEQVRKVLANNPIDGLVTVKL